MQPGDLKNILPRIKSSFYQPGLTREMYEWLVRYATQSRGLLLGNISASRSALPRFAVPLTSTLHDVVVTLQDAAPILRKQLTTLLTQ